MRPCPHQPLTALLLVSVWLLLASGQAGAAGNDNAKLILHALATTTKNPCTRATNIPATCSGYENGVHDKALYPVVWFAYALIVNGSRVEGMSASSFGIDYDAALQSGVDIYNWSQCADAELPSPGWPAPGTGNTISFTTPAHCQTGGNASVEGVAALGYFYCASYTPGTLRITPHPVTRAASVTNCAGAIDFVPDSNQLCTRLGSVGFGMTGNNPCGREILHVSCQYQCAVTGPTEALSGQTGIEYSAVPGRGELTWSIVGNGTFEGPTADQLTVHVTAGAPGQYTVRATFWGTPFPTAICEKTVTVNDPVPAVPVTWTRLKALVPFGD